MEMMNDTISAISALAKRQRELEGDIQMLEESLKETKAMLRDVAEGQIPDLMDSAGVAKITTDDGTVVSVEDVLTASASKRNMPVVLERLGQLNSLDLVQHKITIPLKRGQAALQGQVTSYLDLHEIPYQDIADINTGTLKAFVREKLEEGALGTDDMDDFGVHRVRTTKIKVK